MTKGLLRQPFLRIIALSKRNDENKERTLCN
ncbi:hypothetical protein VPHK567_0318 [Vibrio phage K567]